MSISLLETNLKLSLIRMENGGLNEAGLLENVS